MLPLWQKVWREGFAPCVSTEGLRALKRALETDDDRLIQGGTLQPPPLQALKPWAVEKACALAYCGWQGEQMETVEEVESYFAEVCFRVDQLLGEPAACRYFLNWYDDTPRAEMRRLLLEEVNRILAQRQPAEESAA